MIEVYENLFVGNQEDYELLVSGREGWAVIHACKEPYHRQALGYKGRAAPKDHPEYLVARRENRLILNLVDVDNPAFFRKEMIAEALDFVDRALESGQRVLIHCNQGESRAPSIALLYMAARRRTLPTESLESAESCFRTLYPGYSPSKGIRGHLQEYWLDYCAL